MTGGVTYTNNTSFSSSRDGRIKAVLVSPAGTATITSFEVSPLADGIQTRPRVAYYDGTYLVVWTQMNPTTGFDVLGVRIDGDGTILDSTPIEIDVAARTQSNPDVIAGSAGFVVTWGSYDSTDTFPSVKAVTVNASTGALGTEKVIDDGYAPKIAYNDNGAGSYLVVYSSGYDGSIPSQTQSWQILDTSLDIIANSETYDWFYDGFSEGRSVTSLPDATEGWTWITDHKVPLFWSGGNDFGLVRAVTILPNGTYDSGQALTEPNIVNPGAGATPAWWLDAARDHSYLEWPRGGNDITTDGNYAIAVWGRYNMGGSNGKSMSDSDLHIARVDKYDKVESTSVVVANSSDGEQNPAIDGDESGSLVVAYEKVGLSTAGREIVTKAVTVDGTGITLGSENVIEDTGTLFRAYPDIAYNAVDDNYLMVWQEGFEGLSTYTFETFTESTVLEQDGDSTPEQISIFLPDLPYNAGVTATMRYRRSTTYTWTEGHDLFRILGSYSTQTYNYPGFAWTITGLDQGTDYVVEVTLSEAGQADIIETKTMSTSSLPDAAGTVTTTITAGSTEAQIEAIFAASDPGDVIQFENGTYNVTGLQLLSSASGEEGNPVYVRGESRDGVIISDTSGSIITFSESPHIVLENLTLQGSGVDAGIGGGVSFGIESWGGHSNTPVEDITIRNVTMTGVDRGIKHNIKVNRWVVYNNTFEGNNTWTQDLWGYSGDPGGLYAPNGTPDIDENMMWGDTAIQMGGQGNVAFNNNFTGFGDTVKLGGGDPTSAIHFYRNKITMAGDDAFESDYGDRNVTVYDNKITNAMTCISADPFEGGPMMYFRNICINSGRQQIKANDPPNRGLFYYNNTFVRTLSSTIAPAYNSYNMIWINSNPQEGIGYQNNLSVYQNPQASSNIFGAAPTDLNPIDFTNNGWYPDGRTNWIGTGDGYADDIADAVASYTATTPVFGTSTQRHENDFISEEQPFETAVVLGATFETEITTDYTPSLSTGVAAEDAGVAIAGVTPVGDATPDVGAIMDGLSLVLYGDQTDAATPTVSTPIGAGTMSIGIGTTPITAN